MLKWDIQQEKQTENSCPSVHYILFPIYCLSIFPQIFHWFSIRDSHEIPDAEDALLEMQGFSGLAAESTKDGIESTWGWT